MIWNEKLSPSANHGGRQYFIIRSAPQSFFHFYRPVFIHFEFASFISNCFFPVIFFNIQYSVTIFINRCFFKRIKHLVYIYDQKINSWQKFFFNVAFVGGIITTIFGLGFYVVSIGTLCFIFVCLAVLVKQRMSST